MLFSGLDALALQHIQVKRLVTIGRDQHLHRPTMPPGNFEDSTPSHLAQHTRPHRSRMHIVAISQIDDVSRD